MPRLPVRRRHRRVAGALLVSATLAGGSALAATAAGAAGDQDHDHPAVEPSTTYNRETLPPPTPSTTGTLVTPTTGSRETLPPPTPTRESTTTRTRETRPVPPPSTRATTTTTRRHRLPAWLEALLRLLFPHRP
jgi:hypothetical protein